MQINLRKEIQMLLFSKIQPWQGNEAVQQILVFSSPEMVDLFDREMLDRYAKAMGNYTGTDPEYPVRVKNDLSDSNAGAVYKLRAVKDNIGKWVPIIRCGITGGLIWEHHTVYDTPKMALSICFNHLKSSIASMSIPEDLIKK